MATTLPNTGAIIPAMTEAPDQAVNNAAFTAIDAAIGGIIESGSNANGSYIKFADGTMIAHKYVDFGSTSVTGANGQVYISGALAMGAWPAIFTAVPVVSAPSVSVAGGTCWGIIYTAQTAANAPVIRVYDAESGTRSISVVVIAIGRWK